MNAVVVAGAHLAGEADFPSWSWLSDAGAPM